MSLATFETVLRNLRSDDLLAPGFELLWHVGEPLTVGRDFYLEANQVIESILPGKLGCQTIQTNGLLIDDAWCDVFKEIGAVIGISLDGPKKYHDKNRVTRAGKGTFDAVIKAVEILRRNNVEFYVLSVLDSNSLQDPAAFFKFAKKIGIKRLGLNIEETDGINISNTLLNTDAPVLARRFFDFALSMSGDPGNEIWVREIFEMFGFIQASVDRPIESHLTVPFRIVTVDARGRWSTFCPELIATSSPRFGDFAFGDLVAAPISKGIDRAKFNAVHGEINRGIEICKESCAYFGVCGGGRPANKYAEHGRFDVSETQQCRVYTKALADACVSAVSGVMANA